MTGITVTGRGEASGVPDALEMTVGVSVARPSVGEAVAVGAERASALLETLRDHGLADADIRTAAYSISPEYDYRDHAPPRIVGYRVENLLSIKLHDLDGAGDVLDAAAGAVGDDVRVGGMAFTVVDPGALRAAARAAAWRDAVAKAEQLADLAGLTLGSAVSITEPSRGAGPPVLERAALAVADVATPMQPGQETVVVELTVEFGIDA